MNRDCFLEIMNWIFENWIQSSHCLLFMSNIFVDLRYCVWIFFCPSQWRQRLYEVVNSNFNENFTRYIPVCMCWALTWLHGPVDPVAHLDPLDPMAYKDWLGLLGVIGTATELCPALTETFMSLQLETFIPGGGDKWVSSGGEGWKICKEALRFVQTAWAADF